MKAKAVVGLGVVGAVVLGLLGAVFVPGGTAAADFSAPGPFLAGWTEVVVERPGGSTFEAWLYYPATAEGAGAPYDGSGAPYPGVAFGHGFVQSPDRYASIYEHLASWGYLTIAPQTELGFFPSHQGLADDLSHSLSYLEAENGDPGSFLYGQVDTTHLGLSGHSMGAGASILAAAADGRVRAVANLAAAETNPSAIAAMAEVQVPIRLIAGSEDGMVPVGQNGWPMYQNGRAPRQLPVIEGGWHCGFVDNPAFGFLCDSGSIDRPTQLDITYRLLTGFFNLYLEGEEAAWREVWGLKMARDPEVDTVADPGMQLSPRVQQQSGTLGQTLTYPLTLVNTGSEAGSYALFVESARWPATVIPAQTGVLAPGEGAAITVQVTIDDPAYGSDVAVVSARWDVDGLTRQFGLAISRRTAE